MVLVRDLHDAPETFEPRALQALAALGGTQPQVERRFDLDGAPRLAIVFTRESDAVPDVARRIAPFGVAFEADTDATSQ